ncbi:MAG: NERD domain-containing protein [Fibrobacter sp.]|nr:NERD domain-containing protein [Fibrobacter sp.]
MSIAVLAVLVVILAFLIWGWDFVVLRDEQGRLLSRKMHLQKADEGALIGLAYGTYTFEIWHRGLFHWKPRLVKTVTLEHNEVTENEWNYSLKLASDAKYVRSMPDDANKRHRNAELLTDSVLLRASKGSFFKILNNVYLLRNSLNDTTRIDSVLIHPTGIYLFENVLKTGWIYGDANSKTWHATKMKGSVTKESDFENPMLRSVRNEEALRRMFEGVDFASIPCFSYIVFDDKAVLKDIPESTVGRKFVLRSQLLQSLLRIFSLATPVLSKKEIGEFAGELAVLSDQFEDY